MRLKNGEVLLRWPLSTHILTAGWTYNDGSAHDPVDRVAAPYTEADEAAAQQLASTPSTLPYIDSADVPMLLSDAEQAAEDSTAQPMTMAATLSSTMPVAGTYVVSSQDGTTVLVSLKAMQDGGDAATLGGMTLDDIKQLISDMIAAANGS